MSSSSADNDSGAEEDTINGDGKSAGSHTPTQEGHTNGTQDAGGRIIMLLEEERVEAPTPEPLGNGINRYKKIPRIDDVSEDESSDALPRRAGSPVDSIPDDSPSVQVILGCPAALKPLLTYLAGLCSIFSRWEQCTPIRSLTTWPRQPYPLVPTLR